MSMSLDADAAERQRFQSFTMSRQSQPTGANNAQGTHKHSRSRSHSRNLSLSIPVANAPSTPSPSPGTPKRNSHHRRLSSVSTRHESAEMMGITVPELPVSADTDPGRDSVRRRALWALEGKPDSFREVEIPSLSNDDKVFEFPTKPSFPPGPGLGSAASFAAKRDSFKLLSSAGSNKDTLGTLVEEEEEDERPEIAVEQPAVPQSAPILGSHQPSKRPRPNLRPLSLTPQNLGSNVLPSPNPTPSPGVRSAPLRLKALSLAASAVHSFRGLHSPSPGDESFRTSTPSIVTTDTTEESDSFRSKGSLRSIESFRTDQSFRSEQSFRSDQSFRSSDQSFRDDQSFRAPQSFRRDSGTSDADNSLWSTSSQSFRSSPLAQSTSAETFEDQAEGFQARSEMEHVGRPGASPHASYTNDSCRPQLTLDLQNQNPRPPVLRRSSISYKTSGSATSAEPTTAWSERRLSATSSSSSSSMSSSANWFNSSRTDEDSINTPASSVGFPLSATKSRSNSQWSLSASEQHFLFKSHNALLSRIQDLERALSIRRTDSLGFGLQSSRPPSVVSDLSAGSEGPLSDEALSVIAHLKSERDELKRDIEGWRTRVGDLEKQVGIFAGRIENERREAWVARSRIGLLEVEKNGLEKVLAKTSEVNEDLEKKVGDLMEELGKSNAQRTSAEEEIEKLRERIAELEAEKTASTAAITPKAFTFPARQNTFGFASVSSEDGSTTDVETPYGDDDDSSFSFGAPKSTWELSTELNAVVEEEEEDVVSYHHHHQHSENQVQEFDDEDEDDFEDNGLAGYEDEVDEDEDLLNGMMDCTSSSFGSESDFTIHRSSGYLGVQKSLDVPQSPVSPATPVQKGFTAGPVEQTYQPTGDLSQTWTFPRLAAKAQPSIQEDKPDKFFECLDDTSPLSGSAEHSPSLGFSDYSYEDAKSLFSRSLAESSEDSFAFDAPSGFDAPVDRLATLVEEDEEEEEEEEDASYSDVDDYYSDGNDDVFGEVGGITITFTPAEEDDEPALDSPEQSLPVDSTNSSPVEVVSPSHEQEPGSFAGISRKPIPVYEDEEDEEHDEEPEEQPVFAPSFKFGGRPVTETTYSSPKTQRASQIPRAIKAPTTPPSAKAAVQSGSPASPDRRISFIPQRVTSPPRSPPSPVANRGSPSPTFIRQPKPLLLASRLNSVNDVAVNGNVVNDADDFYRSVYIGRNEELASVDTAMKNNAAPPVSVVTTTPTTSPTTSPLTSARSFFTNFLNPLWVDAPPSNEDNGFGIQSLEPSRSKTIYVSKEKQLEKLKLRLDREGSVRNCVMDGCKRCHPAGMIVNL